MSLPVFRRPELHPKGWGSELWVANCERYCGKLLTFHEGARFSAHFHDKKDETFYVLQGTVRLDYIDPSTAAELSSTLIAGDVVDIPRLCVHRVTALTEAVLIEVSSHHEDSDSFRVSPGDSQNAHSTPPSS